MSNEHTARQSAGANSLSRTNDAHGGTAPLLQPEKGLATALRRCFYIAFCAAFVFLAVGSLFFNPWFSFAPGWVLAAMGLWAVALLGLWRLADRLKGSFAAHEKLWLASFFIVLALTQLLFYHYAAAGPARDFERVYTGAYNYTVAGLIEDPYLDYFYIYPNNMPVTIFLQFVFRVFNRIGVRNFFAVGSFVNGAFLAAGYFFLYLCACRLLGRDKGFFALWVLYLCLPLQYYISVFYTDTLTLPFVPFCLWCWLALSGDGLSLKKKAALYGAMGLVVGFGMNVKYSAGLILATIAIDALLRRRPKALVAVAGVCAAGFIMWSALFSGWAATHVLTDRELAQNKATPLSRYVMMGLTGDGAYRVQDDYFMWSFHTAEEKRAAARGEIKARLSGYTPGQYAAFLAKKALRSFGCADLELTTTAGAMPFKDNVLTRAASAGGAGNNVLEYIAQGWQLLLYLLAAAGAARAVKRGDTRPFLPCLSMFGLLVFLLIWEAGQRYLLNHLPMLVLAAVCGLALLFGQGRQAPSGDRPL